MKDYSNKIPITKLNSNNPNAIDPNKAIDDDLYSMSYSNQIKHNHSKKLTHNNSANSNSNSTGNFKTLQDVSSGQQFNSNSNNMENNFQSFRISVDHDRPDRHDIKLSQMNDNYFECNNCRDIINSHNHIPNIANDLRLSNFEKRLDNLEKMLRFFEDLFRLKEDEKKNEFKIDQNKLLEINKKLNFLDENQRLIIKKLNEQDGTSIEKFEACEKRILKIINSKNSISEIYASKLAELESAMKKSEIIYDSIIEEKLSKIQNNFDTKFGEILSLVNDIGKDSESNEFLIIESKESMRTIQNDHLDFIKIISILKEKTDNIEFIFGQIGEIKEKYNNLIEIYGTQSNEEDKFLQKILFDNKNDK